MENRRMYFLRKPVEYRIQQLADAMSEMASEYEENKGVAIAYQICSDQIQQLLTEIKRDDNNQITILTYEKNISTQQH